MVRVDPAKWTFPPFSATRQGGYVYGRGTLDDKSDLLAAMMTMLMLKRQKTPLDRDVIFVSEAGEEASTGPGIEYLVNEHWSDIDAEFCLAESGGVRLKNGQARYALVETTEKQPKGARLVAQGTGRARIASAANQRRGAPGEGCGDHRGLGSAHAVQRHHALLLRKDGDGERSGRSGAVQRAVRFAQKAPAVREYLAEHDPISYSMLHTSISPNIIKGGYQVNVIPSEAEATLDIRALPDENIAAFYDMMRKVINDPSIELVPETAQPAPGRARRRGWIPTLIAPSKRPTRSIYGVITIPVMSTGATDMAFLRAKGVQCYGVGAMVDEEDAPKGYGPHSDQERILEASGVQARPVFLAGGELHRGREALAPKLAIR